MTSKLIFILLFVGLALASSKKALPSFMLSNYDADKALILALAGSKDCPQEKEHRYVGATTLRHMKDMNMPLVSSDTFGMDIDQGYWLARDPMLFQTEFGGNYVLDKDGAATASYTKYAGSKLPVSVKCSFYMVPNEEFYLVKYHLESSDGKPHHVKLLDAVTSDGSHCDGSMSENNGVLDMSSLVVVTSAINSSDVKVQVGSGDANDDSNPIHQFMSNGDIHGDKSFSGNRVAVGYVTETTVNSSLDLYFFRGVVSRKSDVEKFVEHVHSKTVDGWIDTVRDARNAWLESGVSPSGLSADQKEFYDNSLLSIKHALNPATGTIVASMQPLYSYKTWSRDGVFAALILDGAGFHSEAEQFLKWMATCELRSDGALHTCYDTFTGKSVGFVEPQYDGTAAYLAAVLYHINVTGNTEILDHTLHRVREFEDFFLNSNDPHGLAPPDYSIWEESSDGRSGKSLPTSYFAFTQSMAYLGTRAAAIIEQNWGDSSRASKLRGWSAALKQAVFDQMFIDGYFVRGRWSDSFDVDDRSDSASMGMVWGGLAYHNTTAATSHIKHVANELQNGAGVSRYTNDPFFYDSIYSPCSQHMVGTAAPPWPVVTMFTAWAQMAVECHDLPSVDDRIEWVVDHGAAGNMPVGEGVDGVSGDFVWPGAPDVYEGGGVAALSMLWRQGLAPKLWELCE